MQRVVWMAAVAALVAATARGEDPKTGFLDRTVRIGERTHPFKVYVPPAFDRARKWPVILFLHGGGEAGTDAVRHIQVGLGHAISARPDRYPMIAVFPQVSRGQVWTDDNARMATAALDQTIAEFGGDPDRVSVAGLSLGGYGTWVLAYDEPDRYAAIVSVAGGILPPAYMRGRLAEQLRAPRLAAADPYAATAARVKHIPAWLFHGAEDASVPVTESRKLVEALKKAGGSPRFTEYAGVPHNAWDRAFADPELATWLLAQRRKKRE